MKPIYVEVSDEITTVIERMAASTEDHLALVIPKGAILLQSLVNLKLAKKTAADSGKKLTLVTTDKIGRNLATQVGLPVASKIEDIGVEAPVEAAEDAKMIDGVKVHRYYEEGDGADATENTVEDTGKTAVDPIIPRQIMKEKPAAEPAEVERPIVTREVKTEVAAPVDSKAATTEAAAEAAPVIALPEEAAAEPLPTEPTPSQETMAPVTLSSTTVTKEPSLRPDRSPRFRKIAILGVYLLILLMLAAAGVSAFYLPKTQVTIAIASQPWNKDVTVTAKVGDEGVKAEMITTDLDVSLIAKGTGSKNLGEKAHGTANISNLDSSDPKSLPAGSKLIANGLTFTTDNNLTVPGARIVSGSAVAGSATVPVSAVDPGVEGNMSQVTATVPDQKLFAQIVNTSGGSTKTAILITDTDISTAKASLLQKAKTDVQAKLVDGLQGRDLISDAATDVFTFDAFSSSVAAGGQADTTTVKAKATLKRLVVDRTRVIDGAKSLLAENQSKESTYITDSIDLGTATVNIADQTISIPAAAKGRFSTTLATEPLRVQLKGKNRTDGENLLRQAVKDGTITIKQQPSWWPIHNFPYSDKYLQVLVSYE